MRACKLPGCFEAPNSLICLKGLWAIWNAKTTLDRRGRVGGSSSDISSLARWRGTMTQEIKLGQECNSMINRRRGKDGGGGGWDKAWERGTDALRTASCSAEVSFGSTEDSMFRLQRSDSDKSQLPSLRRRTRAPDQIRSDGPAQRDVSLKKTFWLFFIRSSTETCGTSLSWSDAQQLFYSPYCLWRKWWLTDKRSTSVEPGCLCLCLLPSIDCSCAWFKVHRCYSRHIKLLLPVTTF